MTKDYKSKRSEVGCEECKKRILNQIWAKNEKILVEIRSGTEKQLKRKKEFNMGDIKDKDGRR